MEIFDILETLFVSFALADPLLFSSFLDFLAKSAFSFVDFYIMKNIEAHIDVLFPLFACFFQFYITKTGLEKLGFLGLFGADQPGFFIPQNIVRNIYICLPYGP